MINFECFYGNWTIQRHIGSYLCGWSDEICVLKEWHYQDVTSVTSLLAGNFEHVLDGC